MSIFFDLIVLNSPWLNSISFFNQNGACSSNSETCRGSRSSWNPDPKFYWDPGEPPPINLAHDSGHLKGGNKPLVRIRQLCLKVVDLSRQGVAPLLQQHHLSLLQKNESRSGCCSRQGHREQVHKIKFTKAYSSKVKIVSSKRCRRW